MSFIQTPRAALQSSYGECDELAAPEYHRNYEDGHEIGATGSGEPGENLFGNCVRAV
jgi:hypothetical protein